MDLESVFDIMKKFVIGLNDQMKIVIVALYNCNGIKDYIVMA